MSQNKRNGRLVLKELEHHGIATNILGRASDSSDSIEVPPSLRQLKSLEIEDAQNLPPTIAELQTLEELKLSNCRFSSLPSEIGCLSRLRVMDISNCTALQSLPSSIGALQNLETLSLRNFGGRLPEEIRLLPNLKELLLLEIPVNRRPRQEIFQLSSLKKLSLSFSDPRNRNNHILWSLDKLKRLQELSLSGIEINLGTIRKLSCLERLSFSNCYGRELFRLFSFDLGLKHLTLHNIPGMTGFSQRPPSDTLLESLTYLELSDLPIKEIPHWIGQFRNLTHLKLASLRGVRRPTEGFHRIESLDSLTYLELSDLPSLEVLPIRGKTKLTHLKLDRLDESFEDLPDDIGELSSLTHISLRFLDIQSFPQSIGRLSLKGVDLTSLMCFRGPLVSVDIRNPAAPPTPTSFLQMLGGSRDTLRIFDLSSDITCVFPMDNNQADELLHQLKHCFPKLSSLGHGPDRCCNDEIADRLARNRLMVRTGLGGRIKINSKMWPYFIEHAHRAFEIGDEEYDDPDKDRFVQKPAAIYQLLKMGQGSFVSTVFENRNSSAAEKRNTTIRNEHYI